MARRGEVSSKRVVVTSFVVDLLDIVINGVAALLSGSVVMLSQVLEGVADLISSGLLWIGVSRSGRRPNRDYKYGYGRELFFWVLMATVTMFVLTGVLSFVIGLRRFLNPEPIHHLPTALTVLAIGFCSNLYALSLSLKRLGAFNLDVSESIRRINRSYHIESKGTMILDLMGVSASLFGFVSLLLYVITGYLYFDGIGAMIVGVSCCFFAFILMLEVKDFIIGKGVSREVEQVIVEETESVDGIIQVLDVRTMHVGTEKILVNLEVYFRKDLKVPQIDKLIDKIRKQVQKVVPEAKYIQVEVELPPSRSKSTK